MARFRIKKEFRSRLSEKLMDLGNLSIAALVFGQFLSGNKFSESGFVIGIIFAIVCYLAAYVLSL